MFKDILNNEYYKFILLSVRENKSIDDYEETISLYKRLNKEKIFDITKENGLISIITANLLELGVKDIPLSWIEVYRKISQTTACYFEELSKIADLFFQNKIPLVVLKNGGIAMSIINDLGKCPMGDIDTLVRKKDFEKAHEILLNAGYTFKFRSKREKENFQEAFKNGSLEYYINLKNNTIMWFELSWRLVGGRWIRSDQEFNSEEVIERSIEVPGSKVRVLSPEDNLFQVALHTAKHSYIRAPGFRLHLDVERIVKYQKIDWEVFIKNVKIKKVSTPVFFSLVIPKLILNTPIPDYVLKELKPDQLRERIILEWINKIGLMSPNNKKFTKYEYVFFQSMLYDSFGGFLRVIFPGKEWIKEKYGIKSDFLVPVAIIRRMWDLLRGINQ